VNYFLPSRLNLDNGLFLYKERGSFEVSKDLRYFRTNKALLESAGEAREHIHSAYRIPTGVGNLWRAIRGAWQT